MCSLSWTPPPQIGTAQVYRKGFGDHPRYRAGFGGEPAIPATPAAAVAAGWTLTAVTAPSQTDAPGTRGYWYYVVFTIGSGGTSGPSNRAGALDYLLGDVHNGEVGGQCQGNNAVATEDITYLGAHYGVPVGATTCWRVWTSDRRRTASTSARPSPDGTIEFEDLVMFALNFGTNARIPIAARPAPGGTGRRHARRTGAARRGLGVRGRTPDVRHRRDRGVERGAGIRSCRGRAAGTGAGRSPRAAGRAFGGALVEPGERGRGASRWRGDRRVTATWRSSASV